MTNNNVRKKVLLCCCWRCHGNESLCFQTAQEEYYMCHPTIGKKQEMLGRWILQNEKRERRTCCSCSGSLSFCCCWGGCEEEDSPFLLDVAWYIACYITQFSRHSKWCTISRRRKKKNVWSRKRNGSSQSKHGFEK